MDIEQLEKCLAKATALPWKADMNIGMDALGIYPETHREEFPIAWMPNIIKHEVKAANAALIVEAVNAMPALLARIAALEEALREAKDTFEKMGKALAETGPEMLAQEIAVCELSCDEIAKALGKGSE